ncbi:hypothetical protein QTP88_028849 [Uroleucon formosanum]
MSPELFSDSEMRLISPLSPPQYSTMSPMYDEDDFSQSRAAEEDRGINDFLRQINPTQAPTKTLPSSLPPTIIDTLSAYFDPDNFAQPPPWDTAPESLPTSLAVDENDGPTSFNHSPSNLNFSGVMTTHGEVLGELIKAKENIKRKYTALKQGKADIHSLVSETLSPIIEPLKQHFNKTLFQANNTVEHRNDIDNQDFNDTGDSLDFKINDWFKSYDIDKTYGPKIRANGSVHLGKKEINLVDNTLTIEDTLYPLTQGLEIFKIVKINETLPTKHQIQDYTGAPIAGCFYSEEILKTNYPNDYLVEKIISKKGNQMFVKCISRAIDMNVFSNSQYSETKKNISNLEESIKSVSNKLDKIEHLLEENHKSILNQEEQTEKLELTCIEITEHMTRGEVSLQSIKESTEALKKIPAILSRINTIETYYKDKSCLQPSWTCNAFLASTINI